MDRVKLVVIGAGAMVNDAHAPSLAEMPDVEIAAICDLIAEKAQGTAARFNIPRVYTDYRTMIEEVDPEAVYIVVPPHQLHDIAIYALERGKHVFTEKPPGVYTEQTRQMARAAARNNCLTMVGFQRRFTPITVECRRRVLERSPMYQVVASFLKWYDDGPYYSGAIDILTSDAIHIVDAIRWMAGAEPVDVYSDVKTHGTNYATAFNAFIRFSNNVVGYLQSNHRVGARQLRFEMHGDRISCLVAPEEGALIYADGKLAERLDAAELAGGPEMFRIGFLQQARHFIDCVRRGQQPDTNLANALKTMKLCDLIMQNSPPWTDD